MLKIFKSSTSFLKMAIIQCDICKKAWPYSLKQFLKDSKINGFSCWRCKLNKKHPKKYSSENNMIPSPVPVELKNLHNLKRC